MMKLLSRLCRLETVATILLVAAQCQALSLTRRQNGSVSDRFHHRAWRKCRPTASLWIERADDLTALVLNNGQPRLYIDGGEITTWSGQGDGLMPDSEDNTVAAPGFFWTEAGRTNSNHPPEGTHTLTQVRDEQTTRPR